MYKLCIDVEQEVKNTGAFYLCESERLKYNISNVMYNRMFPVCKGLWEGNAVFPHFPPMILC